MHSAKDQLLLPDSLRSTRSADRSNRCGTGNQRHEAARRERRPAAKHGDQKGVYMPAAGRQCVVCVNAYWPNVLVEMSLSLVHLHTEARVVAGEPATPVRPQDQERQATTAGVT